MDLLNRVFQQYLDLFVILFIDEILVYKKNEGENINHLRVVSQVLQEHQFLPNIASVIFVEVGDISWAHHL